MAILAMLVGLVGFVCWIIVLIHAFKNAIWKGIVGILCALYLIYYAFAEFQHEKKGLIVGIALGSSIIGTVLNIMAAAQAAAGLAK